MRYVYIVDGVVIGEPKQLENNQTLVPNSFWGKDQMVKNGFFLVEDTVYDKSTHKIDYSSPVIHGDLVSYPAIPLSKSELDAIKKYKILNEYPSDHSIIMALYNLANGDNTDFNKIKETIDAVNSKYSV